MLLYTIIAYQHDLLHVIKVCGHASVQHGALENRTLVMKLSLLAVPSTCSAYVFSLCDSINTQDASFVHVPLSRQQVKKLVGERRQHNPVLPP